MNKKLNTDKASPITRNDLRNIIIDHSAKLSELVDDELKGKLYGVIALYDASHRSEIDLGIALTELGIYSLEDLCRALANARRQPVERKPFIRSGHRLIPEAEVDRSARYR